MDKLQSEWEIGGFQLKKGLLSINCVQIMSYHLPTLDPYYKILMWWMNLKEQNPVVCMQNDSM